MSVKHTQCFAGMHYQQQSVIQPPPHGLRYAQYSVEAVNPYQAGAQSAHYGYLCFFCHRLSREMLNRNPLEPRFS